MSRQEEIFQEWQAKQKAMGRKVPDTTAPKYDTQQNECTCERQEDYTRVAGKLVFRVKTIYNPDCMLHGQIGIS